MGFNTIMGADGEMGKQVFRARMASGVARNHCERGRLIPLQEIWLDGVDLSKCIQAARENDHADMADFLSSIIEQRALLGMEPNRPPGSFGAARL